MPDETIIDSILPGVQYFTEEFRKIVDSLESFWILSQKAGHPPTSRYYSA